MSTLKSPTPLPNTSSRVTTSGPRHAPSRTMCHIELENPVLTFLRSCKPNLQHLIHVFTSIGLKTQVDLEGVLDWRANERVSWLNDLLDKELGVAMMNAKALSLAFEARKLVTAGAPRG